MWWFVWGFFFWLITLLKIFGDMYVSKLKEMGEEKKRKLLP